MADGILLGVSRVNNNKPFKIQFSATQGKEL
jgi:hypothetical protein